MRVTGKFTHLHAYHSTDRDSAITTSFFLFQCFFFGNGSLDFTRLKEVTVSLKDTPDNSLLNMYMDSNLIDAVKTKCTGTSENWRKEANKIVVELSQTPCLQYPIYICSLDNTAALLLYIQYSLFFNSVELSL